MRHFITESDITPNEIPELLAMARSFKTHRGGSTPPTLQGQSWGMLFFKSSTRTRISFDVGIHELGGHPVELDVSRMQLGRGESIADTARILSGYLHGLVIRCFEHSVLEEFAQWGTIPVVNALSDFNHPCQIFADAFSIAEAIDPDAPRLEELLKGKRLVYFGDTNSNMAHSWMLASASFGLQVVLSGPESFAPDASSQEAAKQAGASSTWCFEPDPAKAIEGADIVYTDVWASMGQEEEKAERSLIMAPYQVNTQLMSQARPDARFMHCLPAYPGMEVTQEVLDSPQSIIWPQAENRLHMQKAILSTLVGF